MFTIGDTEPYTQDTPWMGVFGIPIWRSCKTPRLAIQVMVLAAVINHTTVKRCPVKRFKNGLTAIQSISSGPMFDTILTKDFRWTTVLATAGALLAIKGP